MPSAPSTRRLAAVSFADIVGYTSLSSRDEGVALELVRILQEVARAETESRGGRVVKFIGDAVMAEFPGVEAALDAGLAIAERFRARGGVAGGEEARLRVGVHLGEITCGDDGDIYGDVVNVASRLQSEAEPGRALVSEDVWRQLRRRPAFLFESAGSRQMKGLQEALPTWVASHRYPEPSRSAGPASGGGPGTNGERKRLVVLPFRVLKPDPDIDFLAFGIPDAVAVTLMGHPSLVVRSNAGVANRGADAPDPLTVAREAQVDLVLSGTVLRAAERVRVTTQLAEGESGTIIWSESTTLAMGDLFDLQDDLARRIVASVSQPLTITEHRAANPDVPASGEAYQIYLKANQVSVLYGDWGEGAELYRRVLALDPAFAPAWARLGRCYRLLGKYATDPDRARENQARAEEAFAQALTLNPDSGMAHNLYAQLEVEAGRPVDAMLRLLERARRHGSDANIFAGLTHALRYCGLHAESIAAHRRARELAPDILTSVAYTYCQTGEFELALAECPPKDPMRIYAFQALRRNGEAKEVAEETVATSTTPGMRELGLAILACLNGDLEGALEHGRKGIEWFPDAEGHYFLVRDWAALGATQEALQALAGAIDRGFACAAGLRNDPFFDSLRPDPAFGVLVERAEAQAAAAEAAFRAVGGPGILGIGEARGTKDAV